MAVYLQRQIREMADALPSSYFFCDGLTVLKTSPAPEAAGPPLDGYWVES
jgi:hypothetical protein